MIDLLEELQCFNHKKDVTSRGTLEENLRESNSQLEKVRPMKERPDYCRIQRGSYDIIVQFVTICTRLNLMKKNMHIRVCECGIKYYTHGVP